MSAISSYSTGLFFEPLEREFGWGRAAMSSPHILGSIAVILFGPYVGHVMDRFGSRRVGIAGISLLIAAFSLLGLTTGNMALWWSTWLLLALTSVLYQPMVWSSAVTSFFSAGRGFALAVTLCGTSLCSVITPKLAQYLIDAVGWRLAFPAIALCWGLVVLPLLWLFFTSAADKQRTGETVRTSHAHPSFFTSFRGEVLTGQFLQVALAGFSIALVVVSVALTIVPILSSSGIERSSAANIAALLGLSSICGRLTIGLLLDRFSGRHIAAVAVCFPIIGSLLLLSYPGSITAASVAVVIFGLALGAELDILAYLTSRYFKLASFGMLFGTIGIAVNLASSVGPVLLNTVYDATDSYRLALWAVLPLCLISATLFLLLGPYPDTNHEGTAG